MTNHARRQFRRRDFKKKMMFPPGRFDTLDFGEPQEGLGLDSVEWHDMRAQAGLLPNTETFGKVGKDGQWQEPLLTTSGKMLGWLYRMTRSTATSLFRWARNEWRN